MLSKLALLILGCIAEKPLNPYEIKKVFTQMNVDKWFPIGSSSIYATIKSLEKKHYISGERTRTGNMPEKTIYSITPQGEEALQQTIMSSLSEVEQHISVFHLGMMLLCHVPKEQALQAVRTHQTCVRQTLAGIEQQYAAYEVGGYIPYTGLIGIKHTIYKLRAELTILHELLEHIHQDQEWDHFPVSDLLRE
jgi:DNA-binding PadR family transcriptional regulator